MATIEELSARDEPAKIVEILDRDGAVMVHGFINDNTVEAINAEIDADMQAADPTIEHINPMITAFFGDRTKHLSSVAAISRTFATEVLVHPIYRAACDVMLLPNCANYHLNLAHVINRGPGSDAQMFHRDEDVWIHMPHPRPEMQVASMLALVDFTEDRSATMIVPGSHRWADRARQPTPDEIAHAVMPAGSAVLYLGSTIHAGGANTTADVWRRGGHVSFCWGWLRTEENNYLGTPPEIARTLPREVQEILGYGVHDAIADAGGYLGVVRQEDPIDLLADGRL
ncbi:MAG: mitomycin antibiotic biosynthesis protein [Acidimicrobiales bacterium]|nr:mitomycin antibiotic biosynthesis protein [Acidimicrobiales bacterium]